MSRLFVNIDTDDCGGRFLNSITAQREDVIEPDLYPFIDQYKGRGVTDVMICLGGQYSFPESRVLSDSVFKYEQREENGFPVDYRERFVGVYKMYKEHHIDPIAVWVDRCRDGGMTPWLSFRMNDRHCSRADTSDQRPTLFYEAKRNGWMLGERYGSYKTCMSFAVDEIKKIWLDYIDEQLSKYDADGVELDFQREIHCLDYLGTTNCHEIMTEFIRSVRETVDRHARLKGHPIRLGCRLTRDIDQSLTFGFDARRWDKEGIVDMIVVTPRWETCDSDMPIKEWKKELKNTEIYAGLETLINCGDVKMTHASAEALAGYSNRYLSDGADGMYFFNYYPVPGDMSDAALLHRARSFEAFAACSDISNVLKKPMRYIVTRQDIAPEGCEMYKPLPIDLSNGEKQLEINVGKLPSECRTYLVIGIDGAGAEELAIKSDGRVLADPLPYIPRPEGLSSTNNGCGYVPEGSKTYRYLVDTAIDGVFKLSFGGCGRVTYAEIEIEL